MKHSILQSLPTDVRARLVDNGIPVTSFIMDGTVCYLNYGFKPKWVFVANCMYGRFFKPEFHLVVVEIEYCMSYIHQEE